MEAALLSQVSDGLQSGTTPHLRTFVSSAVRLCVAAQENGIDLSGARVSIGGEPVTPSRVAMLTRAGIRAVPTYGTAECSNLGRGCLAPEFADEIHWFHDLNAVVQPGPDGATKTVPPTALLVSSVHRNSMFTFLNLCIGDQAVIEERGCGCPLESLGWTTRMHSIRSYEKLTAGGMAFPDSDVINTLKHTLPSCFGGAPTDYQLLEFEDDKNNARIKLLIHPRLGSIDETAVTRTLLTSLSSGSDAQRVMGLMWQNAGIIQIERRPPVATATGKILHMYSQTGKQQAHPTRSL